MGTLVLADIDLAVEYAKCKAKQAKSVAAYDEAKRRIDEASKKASESNTR